MRLLKVIIVSMLIIQLSCINDELEREISVETGECIEVQYTTAILNGKVVDFGEGVEQYGHCWSINSLPTITDSISIIEDGISGEFISDISNLENGTKYFYRSYAKNGTEVVYGEVGSFTTVTFSAPIFECAVFDVDSSFIELRLKFLDFGGSESVLDYGVYWSENENPENGNELISLGEIGSLGSYTIQINNLKKYTLYYLYVYAENESLKTSKNLNAYTKGGVAVNLGLSAYYPFNGNANDYTENANHGIVYGATLTSDRFGNTSSAYNFDGLDDYINCGNDLILNQEFTISVWFKCFNQDYNNYIIDKYNWKEPWLSGVSICTVDESDIRFGGRNNTNQGYFLQTSNANLTDGEWRNVIGIIRNNVWELWIDGVLISTINSISGEVNNEDNLIIGNLFYGYEDQNRYFDGSIDDIRIYNRPLTGDEIKALYHEGGWDE